MFAVLMPLLSFTVIVLGANALGKAAGNVATGAILMSAILSFCSLFVWLGAHWPEQAHHGDHAVHGEAHDVGGHAVPHSGESEHEGDAHPKEDAHGAVNASYSTLPVSLNVAAADHDVDAAGHGEETADHDAGHASHEGGHHGAGPHYAGDWYVLGDFGKLKMSIGYYILSLIHI